MSVIMLLWAHLGLKLALVLTFTVALSTSGYYLHLKYHLNCRHHSTCFASELSSFASTDVFGSAVDLFASLSKFAVTTVT